MAPKPKPMVTRRRERDLPGFSSKGTAPLIEEATPEQEPAAAPPVAGPPTAATALRAAPPDVGTDNAEGAHGTSDRSSDERRNSRREAKRPAGGEVVKPGGHRVQTNFRLLSTEMDFVKQKQRSLLDEDEIKTDSTELVHALIYAARRGEIDPLEALRHWRRDFNAI